MVSLQSQFKCSFSLSGLLVVDFQHFAPYHSSFSHADAVNPSTHTQGTCTLLYCTNDADADDDGENGIIFS